MHIEPGVVEGSKILLAYVTAAASLAYAVKVGRDSAKNDGLFALMLRTGWRSLWCSRSSNCSRIFR